MSGLTDIFGAGGVAGLLSKVIDVVWPDPAKKAEAAVALLDAQNKGLFKQMDADLQLALGQLEVNKVEATGGFFRSGWRPFVGWVCGVGLAYQFLARPLFSWLSEAWLHVPVPPALEIDTLMTLLFGMLGLGTLRSVEKVKGVADPPK